MTGPMHIHTIVELWIGEAAWTRCVADVFSNDELTITTLDGHPMDVYRSGQWRRATTFDARGYPIATYIATTPTRTLTPDDLSLVTGATR
jgi:hypothetical protein